MLSTREIHDIRLEIDRQIKNGNSLTKVKKALIKAKYSSEEVCELCSTFEPKPTVCNTYCDMEARKIRGNLERKRKYMACGMFF